MKSKPKYSKDCKVKFYQDSHTYWLGDKQLKSVSSYVGNYKSKFESGKIADAIAKRDNRDVTNVKLTWSLNSEMSCEIGSYAHNIIENYILTGNIEFDSHYPKSNVAAKIIQELFESERLKPIETELIVYNDNYAGQIDCIAVSPKGEYFILDWKTNGRFDRENNYGNVMSGYYKGLYCCHLNHYSIQLAAYKAMCKEYNIKGCFIVHIGTENYEIIPALNLPVYL